MQNNPKPKPKFEETSNMGVSENGGEPNNIVP